jgi:hypothetical protein
MNNVEEYRIKTIKLSGRRVRCDEMNDPQPVESGTLGTISHVDDMGTIHVNWDNGRTLGLVPEEDKFTLF